MERDAGMSVRAVSSELKSDGFAGRSETLCAMMTMTIITKPERAGRPRAT
jgi:hypothetical protein